MKTLEQLEARAAIPDGTNRFNITNAGSFYLAGNLSNFVGPAILINASDVVLDLNGFLLVKTSAGFEGAIFVPTPQRNVTVRNDTGWTHYDPLGTAFDSPKASFTFPNGGYRIKALIPPSNAAGPSRAGSVREDTVYSDFFVRVDVLAWDDTVRQSFGLLARVNTPGLQTSTGYAFTTDRGSGIMPTSDDTDISRHGQRSHFCERLARPGRVRQQRHQQSAHHAGRHLRQFLCERHRADDDHLRSQRVLEGIPGLTPNLLRFVTLDRSRPISDSRLLFTDFRSGKC